MAALGRACLSLHGAAVRDTVLFARLRELADNMPDNWAGQPSAVAALREYADLLEQAERGVTDEVVDAALDTWFGSRQYVNWCDYVTLGNRSLAVACRKDMRATLLAVAPLLAAMPQSGKEGM